MSLAYADFSAFDPLTFEIRIVYSIKSSLSVFCASASIPASRMVSIALLIVFTKIRMSFITALLFPR